MGFSFAAGRNRYSLPSREGKKSKQKYTDSSILYSPEPAGRLLHIYDNIPHILTFVRASYLKPLMAD